MPMVVFVAPFYMTTTMRFLDAVANLPDVALCVVSQDAPDNLPEAVCSKIEAHRQIADALDPGQIADAVRELAGRHGAPVRLLGVLEQLQVPLARVREGRPVLVRSHGAEALRTDDFHETSMKAAGGGS